MPLSSAERKIHFNIGVAGSLDEVGQTAPVQIKVTDILSAIKERVLSQEHTV